jgi:hypothetical protein
MFEAILDGTCWVEQFQLYVVIVRPTLKKSQHAQAAALDGIYVRQFNNHNPGVSLRQNCVTQVISSLTVNNPSFALHDSDVTDYLDMYVEHDVLRNTILSKQESCRHPKASVLYDVETSKMPVERKIASDHEKIR